MIVRIILNGILQNGTLNKMFILSGYIYDNFTVPSLLTVMVCEYNGYVLRINYISGSAEMNAAGTGE